jgi:hypothetical protein
MVSEGRARCLRELADKQHPEARRNVLVMDNLNIPSFDAAKRRRRSGVWWKGLKSPYTAKPGSWLNMAQMRIGVLSRQCLNRRIAALEQMRTEVKAWAVVRNKGKAVVH